MLFVSIQYPGGIPRLPAVEYQVRHKHREEEGIPAMRQKIFKGHPAMFGRLVAWIQKTLARVSNPAFTKEMPRELREARSGDRGFSSERAGSTTALFVCTLWPFLHR